MCHDLGILPIFLPAHSSHLTQPLDVRLFAIHKPAIHRIRSPKWMNSQTAQIMKILGAWQVAATPPNIISAFKQTGLHASWDRSHGALVMLWIWRVRGSSIVRGQLKNLSVNRFE
jgi:hypothetical protein